MLITSLVARSNKMRLYCLVKSHEKSCEQLDFYLLLLYRSFFNYFLVLVHNVGIAGEQDLT